MGTAGSKGAGGEANNKVDAGELKRKDGKSPLESGRCRHLSTCSALALYRAKNLRR
jgi:hypothetical protein